MFLPALELSGNLEQAISQPDVVGAIAGQGFVALTKAVLDARSTGSIASFSDMMSICDSTAHAASGIPRPRNGQPRSLLV